MVKTYEDVEKCKGCIDRLEQLRIPPATIRNLRRWLDREVRKIKKKPDRPGAAGVAVGAHPHPPMPATAATASKELE